MTFLGQLQIFAQHGAIVRMRTVFYYFLGTAQGALATKVGHALLRHNDIHVVLCAVHVAAHRHDG